MLRNHLIAEDDSLELKTLTNEGMVLIVDSKRIHRLPLLHFIGRIKGSLHIASKKIICIIRLWNDADDYVLKRVLFT